MRTPSRMDGSVLFMGEKEGVSRMKVVSWLLDLLYPPKCIFCGKLLNPEEEICPACWEQLPVTDAHSCVQRGQWFQACVSPFFMEGLVRRAMHQYKFCYQEANGVLFGRWMARYAQAYFREPFDLITWVPVHWRRRWKRGFDQSKLLAEEMARAYGVKPVQTLKKLRNTKPLSRTKGGKAVRRSLVEGIYGLSCSEHLEGKRVLLVDDVITTGSTLNEASRMLRQAGAAEVCCVTAARSRDRRPSPLDFTR